MTEHNKRISLYEEVVSSCGGLVSMIKKLRSMVNEGIVSPFYDSILAVLFFLGICFSPHSQSKPNNVPKTQREKL